MSEQEKAGGKGVQRQAPIVLPWIDGTHATYTQCHKGGLHTVSLWIEGTNITYKEKTWEGFTSCCFTLMGRLQLTQGVRRDCLAPRRSFGIDATDVIHMGHPWAGGVAHRVALDRWLYRTQSLVTESVTPKPFGSMGPLHLTAGVVENTSLISFESMHVVACKQIHERMPHIVFL